jgi:CO dehydrogenase maturation factor
MKIAISGKGGVGKSTLAAALALLLAKENKRILAVDADPDANLASALGIPLDIQQKIVPISQQKALIEERTGAKVKQYGQMFKLNPEVSDIADTFATVYNGISLLVLGAIEQGGGGCACPENVLIRALVTDLILYKDDALIMDMEAGVEHLGRATVSGVDTMIVVVEPGQRSIDCANTTKEMAEEIGLKRIEYVANKIMGIEDEQFIKEALGSQELLGIIPYSEDIRHADRHGVSVIENVDENINKCFIDILHKLRVMN